MKKFITKVLRVIRSIIIIITIVGLALYASLLVIKTLTEQNSVEYNKPAEEEPAEVIEAPKKNDVEEAERMLAEANAKLDAEEAKLEEEIATIEAEAQAQVDEREAKIAEINKIRASF